MRKGRIKVFQKNVGANVQRLRVAHDMTQEQLAEKAGVDWRTLQNVERAKTNFTVAVLVGIADAFDVDPATLLAPSLFPPATIGRPPRRQRKP